MNLRIGSSDAGATLWWSEVPPWPGGRMGCIGEFSAPDEETAKSILWESCVRLAEQGCTVAVGPLDGSTWARHRYVIWSGGRPPFFLEPANEPELPGWWRAAGFSELARYRSSRLELGTEAMMDGRIRRRMEAAGVSLRKLRREEYEAALGRIHAVCLSAFAGNFLYTPLSRDRFIGMYRQVESVVREDFVWLAEAAGEVCGFVFCLADAEAMKRDERPDLIVKTLAVMPDRRMAGLGSVLVDQAQEAARRAGFTHSIHALQHESNSSLRITARQGGEVLRRYALFSKELA